MERRTAIGFNPQHKLHYNTITVDHPEHPNRIIEIEKRLGNTGLLEECQVLKVSDWLNLQIFTELQLYRTKFQEFPPLDSALLEKAHSQSNLSNLQRLKSMDQEAINEYVQEFDSVNMTKVGNFPLCELTTYNF
jgi:acetoin utilization deacetylase AcuC-like enzyme